MLFRPVNTNYSGSRQEKFPHFKKSHLKVPPKKESWPDGKLVQNSEMRSAVCHFSTVHCRTCNLPLT
jgi:hypothetical protein